jgi:hypothetical protein
MEEECLNSHAGTSLAETTRHKFSCIANAGATPLLGANAFARSGPPNWALRVRRSQ